MFPHNNDNPFSSAILGAQFKMVCALCEFIEIDAVFESILICIITLGLLKIVFILSAISIVDVAIPVPKFRTPKYSCLQTRIIASAKSLIFNKSREGGPLRYLCVKIGFEFLAFSIKL